MGKMFSAPKPAEPVAQAAQVTQATPVATPIPMVDDAAARREKLRQVAKVARSTGRQSTLLTGSRLGDDSVADTRAGTGSKILMG